MRLQNIVRHKRGTVVNVNGTHYQIDDDGFVEDVAPEHAERLLKNDAWRVVGSGTGVQPKRARPGMSLVTATGEIISAPEPEPEAPVVPEAPVQEEAPARAPVTTGDDWPDPDESMDLDYLKNMAKAYGVRVTKKSTKKSLVQKIKAAMYD
jgi:hypothetical protein